MILYRGGSTKNNKFKLERVQQYFKIAIWMEKNKFCSYLLGDMFSILVAAYSALCRLFQQSRSENCKKKES